MDLGIYLIAILLGLEGLINLCGVLIPIQNISKYTDESVKSYYKKAGVCYVIMAVGAVLESVAKSGTVLHDAGWVLFIAGVIIPMFVSKGLQSK